MILSVENLQKNFLQGGNKLEILKGVSFNLSSGKSAAIVGKSGSGKSTLLSLLAGIDRPNTGSINLEGINLIELDEKELTVKRAQEIGIIFQQFHLLPHLKAWENVSLALDILGIGNSKVEAHKALEKVGLSERAEHFPSELSGGEKQRVAIARAIVVKPRLLLADEPSGSLDEETGDEVMDLIFSLVNSDKMAMILVTHNKDLASRCHDQYVLEHGLLAQRNN
ncbi:MAG: ABC transporter ATP-binding protein [Halobacteriovoraceae bacterium]|jgi:putative ABC transport system ATP-binding protein|nr:ABC transporter ATP-binding protein [Halobacteriovoraceae bacterium]MBT5095230.1 ABC transporter ATP-binding protein [Halobacteriovoraceae bacterium]